MNAVKKFRMEQFMLGNQVFKSIFLSFLLKSTFFGPNLSFLKGYEVVVKNATCTIVHIHSRRRLIQLFTKNELYPFEYMDGDIVITSAWKLILIDRVTGKETFGYIVDECDVITVKVANGESFSCR